MAVTLQSHRGEAIRHLAGELSRCGEETLIAILTLLLCEVGLRHASAGGS